MVFQPRVGRWSDRSLGFSHGPQLLSGRRPLPWVPSARASGVLADGDQKLRVNSWRLNIDDRTQLECLIVGVVWALICEFGVVSSRPGW